MRKILTSILFTLLINTVAFGFFRTSVAPGTFEVSLDRTATEEIILVNNSATPIKVKIYEGMDKNTPEENYLGEWIRIYPKLMTLAPNSERRVKFSVKAPDGTKDGEYQGIIFVEELPDVVEGVNTLTLAGRHGLTVYGTKGRAVYEIEITKASVKDKALSVTVENKGKYSIRPEIEVRYMDGTRVVGTEKITGRRVLQGRTVELTGELKDVKGKEAEIILLEKGKEVTRTKITI